MGEFKSIRSKIKKLSKTEDFREDSIESSLIVKDISRLFSKELEVIGDFIVENSNSRSVVTMTRYFLLQSPIGNLGHLRKEMERVFDNNNVSYLNVCCLRIIFPSIVKRVDLAFLNDLKLSLYEDDDSSFTVQE